MFTEIEGFIKLVVYARPYGFVVEKPRQVRYRCALGIYPGPTKIIQLNVLDYIKPCFINNLHIALLLCTPFIVLYIVLFDRKLKDFTVLFYASLSFAALSLFSIRKGLNIQGAVYGNSTKNRPRWTAQRVIPSARYECIHNIHSLTFLQTFKIKKYILNIYLMS